MHEAHRKLLHVKKKKEKKKKKNNQNHLWAQGLFSEKTKTKDPIGSRWLIKEELEKMLVEKLSDQEQAQSIWLLKRLSMWYYLVLIFSFPMFSLCISFLEML